jgi:hypothetical protein
MPGYPQSTMRDRHFDMRVSSEELAAYSAEAARDGLSVSGWIRRRLEQAIELQRSLDERREFDEKQRAFYDSLKH